MIEQGSHVTVRIAPRRDLRRLVGCPAVVQRVYDESPHGRAIRFTEIVIDDGSEAGVAVPDVPADYLSPAIKAKSQRRQPLTLKPPKDHRTEAQRLADGAVDLEKLGYRVFRIGQSRAAAICHKCSRESRERGGPNMIRILCRTCGSLGFSPSTNSTEGTPDTFIYRPDWPPCLWFPMEWKDSPSGARTDEQKELEALGRIAVVWDTPSAYAAILRFEEADPRIKPHPLIVEYLAQTQAG